MNGPTLRLRPAARALEKLRSEHKALRLGAPTAQRVTLLGKFHTAARILTMRLLQRATVLLTLLYSVMADTAPHTRAGGKPGSN